MEPIPYTSGGAAALPPGWGIVPTHQRETEPSQAEPLTYLVWLESLAHEEQQSDIEGPATHRLREIRREQATANAA